jgi:hypothetical protein
MGYDMRNSHPDGEISYFQANIRSMRMLREVLEEAGVLDVSIEHPPFVKVSEEEQDRDENAWDVANAAVISFRSTDPTKVHVDKFCSNDGWHVVPEECILIGTKLQELLDSKREVMCSVGWSNEEHPMNRDFVQEFATYCLFSAKYGGFKVR